MGRVAVTQRRAAFALVATWATMGLWHGAAWTFVVWGLWHAALILLHRLVLWLARGVALPRGITGLGTAVSLFLLMLGWLPFRADSMADVSTMLSTFLHPHRWLFIGLRENTYLIAAIVFMITLAGPFVWTFAVRLGGHGSIPTRLTVWASMTALLAIVLLYLGPLEQFIYFQF